MDKIGFLKDRDSTCHRLLIAAVTKLSKEEKKEFMEHWKSTNDHEMCLTVDSIFTFSIKKVMEEWDKQLDHMIEKKAKLLIENKMAELWESVEEATEEIGHTMQDLMKKLNSEKNYKKHWR